MAGRVGAVKDAGANQPIGPFVLAHLIIQGRHVFIARASAIRYWGAASSYRIATFFSVCIMATDFGRAWIPRRRTFPGSASILLPDCRIFWEREHLVRPRPSHLLGARASRSPPLVSPPD